MTLRETATAGATPPCTPFATGGTAKAVTETAMTGTATIGISRFEHSGQRLSSPTVKPTERLGSKTKHPIGFPPLQKGSQAKFAVALAAHANRTILCRQRQRVQPA